MDTSINEQYNKTVDKELNKLENSDMRFPTPFSQVFMINYFK